jgi:undecaprenyl-diphosphatase
MSVLQALILGLLQGATEFIPVSSSAHLTLLPWLLRWTFDPTFQLTFDVLTHWGTLLALVAVFGRDLWDLLRAGLCTLAVPDLPGIAGAGGPGRWLQRYVQGVGARIAADPTGRLAWLILVGSLPAAVLGVLLESFFKALFGAPRIVSILLCVTAGLLAFSEWRGRQHRDLPALRWLDALIVGLAQAVAIAPGISRSGATMAAGLWRGLRREAAARFSFLLCAPAIIGAGLWQLKDLLAIPGWAADVAPLLVGLLAAAVAGYACIRFLLSYLRRGRLYPFAVYCLVVGVACLIISFLRGT